jgi:uncharacterized protein (TIGR00251 family)
LTVDRAAALRNVTRIVDGHVHVIVRAKPRSKREGVELAELAGDDDNSALVVRVRAPPVEGAANERIVEVLAAVLQVRKRDVTIVRGEASREKDVQVRGMSVDDVVTRLAAALVAPE